MVALRACTFVAGLAAVATAPLAAQDSHYWAETYGTYATLLGGIVVGKVPDLSATFYNPGRLAFTERPALSLAARVYQVRSFKVDVAPTPYDANEELGASSIRPTASFAGGVLPIGDRQRVVTAYSFLSRQSEDLLINESQFGPVAGQPTGGELYWNRQVSESWYGFSLGYRLGAKTGVGATLFGAYRSQFQRSQLTAQIDSAPPQASTITRQFSYTDWRVVVKAGVSTELGRWALGATVTTPGLHVLGSGSAFLTEVATPAGARFAWRAQEGIPVSFKSPWAIAAGAARPFGATTLYVMAEWFAPVARYTLLDADSVVPTDGRPAFDDDVTLEQQAVLDWGIGFEHHLRATRSIYAHFKVDRAARPRNSTVNGTYDRWGTYHVGGGYAFRLGSWDLVVGLTYSWGRDRFVSGETAQPPGGVSIPAGTSATVTDRRLRFLLGFNVRF